MVEMTFRSTLEEPLEPLNNPWDPPEQPSLFYKSFPLSLSRERYTALLAQCYRDRSNKPSIMRDRSILAGNRAFL